MANNSYDLVISIHILPYELEDYRRILNRLNQSIQHISPDYNIIIHSTLNLNEQITDWRFTKPSKGHLIKLYEDINATNTYKGSVHELNYEILGVDDHRRISIEKFSSHTSHMSFLDCDLYFNKTQLGFLLNGSKQLSGRVEYYILSPQVVKLWDNTWDCLVNSHYKQKSHSFYKTQNPNPIVNKDHGKVSIHPLNKFKWGGGWFNIFSMNLLSFVGIPDSFIGYGLDDTFIMGCAQTMREYKYPIRQYILKNLVVMENHLTSNTAFRNKFKTNDLRNKLLRHCHSHHKEEHALFLSKLKQTPYI
jgi:hypothetical protein